MQTNIKSDFNPSKTVKEFKTSFNKARMMLKSEITKDSAPLTPMRDGTLIKSVTSSIRKNDAYLVWNSPYASFLYRGEKMVGQHSKRAWARKYERKITNGEELKYSKKTNFKAGANWFGRAKKKNIDKWIKIYSKGAMR